MAQAVPFVASKSATSKNANMWFNTLNVDDYGDY